MGTVVAKILTAKNLGSSDLTLGPSISVPVGFRVSSGFGSTTLPPGASTTFTVQLDANTVGSYSGTLSFTNNDRDENPFDIIISGTVTGQPLPPVNILATDGTYADRVEVTWTASLGATSYKIYRSKSTNKSSKKTTLGTTLNTFFHDSTAAPKRIYYYYWVKASNAYGISDFSAYDSGYRSGTSK